MGNIKDLPLEDKLSSTDVGFSLINFWSNTFFIP